MVQDTAKLIKLLWPDTKQVESGYVEGENDEAILFRSLDDGSVNWVPKKYIKK